MNKAKVLLELAKRSKLDIVLDENILMLKEALREYGFKVIILESGLSDEEVGELAEGDVILTKNYKHFLHKAVIYDYDIISVDNIKFFDPDKTRKNQTVSKIAKAIRESEFYNMRGNFLLTIRDSGKWNLKELK